MCELGLGLSTYAYARWKVRRARALAFSPFFGFLSLSEIPDGGQELLEVLTEALTCKTQVKNVATQPGVGCYYGGQELLEVLTEALTCKTQVTNVATQPGVGCY